MRKFRMSRLAILLSVCLTALTLIACAALKVVSDVMVIRAQQFANAAVGEHDARNLLRLNGQVTRWSIFADCLAWVVATLVVGGAVTGTVGFYLHLFRPLTSLASTMKRFSDGDRAARAETGAGLELSTAAEKFNEMADIITGQHERMLNFLGGATHELKEPLHVMRTSVREFVSEKRFPNERLARQRLAVVLSELDRLDRMVNAYLDASHVEWRRLDLQQGRHDLRRIVQQASHLYERFSQTHHVIVTLPEQPVWVFADPDRLAQVAHTFLTNAIAFSPKGGAVEVHLSVSGKEAILRVTDYGIGIREDDLATIFEPFQRVTSAFQNSPGVPVALSVARRIVQSHQGRIEAFSKVGEGSTFRAYMPVAAPIVAEEAASGREAAQEHQAGGHDGRTQSSPQAAAPR